MNDSNTRAARGSGDRPAVMTDVAKLAGVSHQTVSRVLNDSPQVRPETRERVLAAVAELGYRPNAMARGLVSRRSKVLGVVTFDTILYGPACMLLGIERAARAAGYGVSIVTLERVDRAGVLAAVDTLAGQGVDGVIIIAPQIAAAAALHNLPARPVAVAVEAGQDAPLPSAAVDQFEGARLAVRHLLDLGHATVWHVSGPSDSLEARDRLEGWRRTLAAAGAAVPPPIGGDWSARSGYEAGLMLAAQPGVTAVFASGPGPAARLRRAGNHSAGRHLGRGLRRHPRGRLPVPATDHRPPGLRRGGPPQHRAAAATGGVRGRGPGAVAGDSVAGGSREFCGARAAFGEWTGVARCSRRSWVIPPPGNSRD
ncbi:LacI family DNA-binding transcriptional regulator [Nocardia wallacei]|uniref:LacI family DNA-binding transcriptional regulator n=1 Tax=Nocardia wallacei TaxID=480035 RepID=UPI003CC7EABA